MVSVPSRSAANGERMKCRESHVTTRVPLGTDGDGARRLRRFSVRKPTGQMWHHGVLGRRSGLKAARQGGARRLSIVAKVRAGTAGMKRSPSPSPREARTGRGPGRGVLHPCERPHQCGAPPLPGPLLHSEWRRGRRRPRCGLAELSQRMLRSKSGGRDGGVGFIGRSSAVRTSLRRERRALGVGAGGGGHGPVDGLRRRWRRGEGVGGERSGD